MRRLSVLSALVLVATLGPAVSSHPYLHKQGTATQLVVGGKPFLMLGVETTNKLLAFLLDKDEKPDGMFEQELQGHSFQARTNRPFPDKDAETEMVTPFAVVIRLSANDFVAIGTKMTLEVPSAGIRSISAQSGHWEDSTWIEGQATSFEASEGCQHYCFTNDRLAIEQVRFRIVHGTPQAASTP